MDVFALDDRLIDQYRAFARSFTRIRSTELKSKVDALYTARRFWPEPLIQLNPHYEGGQSVRDLVSAGGLSPETAQIFRASGDEPGDDPSLKLRRHQEQAISYALAGKSYVVTTGTGSGKSLCFFIPIVDAVIKAKKSGEGARTRAIVIYPMNALANSQQEELRKFLANVPAGTSVTFGRYTGQESEDDRTAIMKNPPDILLTNFMMLELLMTRQAELDRKVIENCKGLRFIVLDELHTYRGRQGADVALLMRRLRARIGDPAHPAICVGTSATMATQGTEEDRNTVVAGVASQLFGTTITRDAVITETLKRATDKTKSADKGVANLADAVQSVVDGSQYSGKTNDALGNDPLAIWVETRLGLAKVDSKPERAKPRSIKDAAEALAVEAQVDAGIASVALQKALLAFSLPEKERGVTDGKDEPLFAFKLHQFIAGAGRLYTTLDPAGSRSVRSDGQIFDPDFPEKRLYAAHFCRQCGQEHHPVYFISDETGERFEKREIDDTPSADDDDDDQSGEWGFLMPEPVDGEFTFQGRDEDYPDQWLEEAASGEVRLKRQYRNSKATLVSVMPNGHVRAGGRRAWFTAGKFKHCAACGDYHSDGTRDINRLSSLSAEGRSSATTIIIAAILRWLNDPTSHVPGKTRKLLSFTDNRQDAALQAGHFNDFVFVTLLRGATLAVLAKGGAEGVAQDVMGAELQKMLGFLGSKKERRVEWLFETELLGANLIAAEKSIREALAHRFWIDQRRGWRFTNPNLEQLGLFEARYASIEDLAADQERFALADPVLRDAKPEERLAAAKVIFDYMRKGLAVECDALDRVTTEALAGRMRGVVKAPWAIDDERIRSATTFVLRAPRQLDISIQDNDLILRGSAHSALGRELKKLKFRGEYPKHGETDAIVSGILRVATDYGVVTTLSSPVSDDPGYRLLPIAITFAPSKSLGEDGSSNKFFRDLYEEIARLLASGGEALFGYEGREHTAQVEGEIREIREARFRYGDDDKKFLASKAEKLRENRENNRFLPTLFCSPTMELGVDISAMNVIYLRNMPPTPANYVQRSGRAGRSGQAALVVSYCAAQSPHDQYFFRKPIDMVAGIVEPPAIDLTNPDLVDSHLQAEWLAASGAALQASIKDNLEMDEKKAPGKPLLKDLDAKVRLPATVAAATKSASAVLTALAADYGKAPPEWFKDVNSNANAVVAAAPEKFNKAFDRWRDLLAAAERQVAEATETLKDYSIGPQERKAAELRQAAGNAQIKLLLRGSEGQGSDFYVYRYLATEGFLPGYNFPRLPLMAFIPGGAGGKAERFIQRARFLAIAEFGPGSLVYHEGRAYRVDRALLREAGGGPDGNLPTFSAALCPACGADHIGEPPEECHVCRHPLAGNNLIKHLYRVDNVGTRSVERITANDEERRRQGFEIQTAFSFRHASGKVRKSLADKKGQLATVIYATAAEVRRINKGLRRRQNKNEVGFFVDPRSGYWASDPAKEKGLPDPTKLRQRIAPVVEDRKNALLLRFPTTWLAQLDEDIEPALATLQHALARGVEQVYQLEEGEIMVEPMPSRTDRKALFFYEAAEGGAGALSRLINEADGFAKIAHAALEMMHFDKATFADALTSGPDALTDVEAPECVAACYRCLLSYFNQPDHELINRRNPAALDILLRLTAIEPTVDPDGATGGNPPEGPDGCPPPDGDRLVIEGASISWVWRRARVVGLEESAATDAIKAVLDAKGFDAVIMPAKGSARVEAIERLTAVLRDAGL